MRDDMAKVVTDRPTLEQGGESVVTHIDAAREREARGIGRPEKAEPFRAFVVEALARPRSALGWRSYLKRQEVLAPVFTEPVCVLRAANHSRAVPGVRPGRRRDRRCRGPAVLEIIRRTHPSRSVPLAPDLDVRRNILAGKYRIVTVAIDRRSQNFDLDYAGIRVTPNIYTTLEEIDTFAAAMEDALESGVPTA
jgi:hypothetical protein